MILRAAEARHHRHPGCSRCRRLKAVIDRSGVPRSLHHRNEDIKILPDLPVGRNIAPAWLSGCNSAIASRIRNIRNVPDTAFLASPILQFGPILLDGSRMTWRRLTNGGRPFMLARPPLQRILAGAALILPHFGSRPMIQAISGL